MSRQNAKNKDKPCTRAVCKGSDFCKYHKKYGVYLDKTLKKVKRKDMKSVPLDGRKFKKQKQEMKENLINNYITESLKNIQCKSTDFLDKHYLHGLMGMVDSWSSVPLEYRIKIDDCWWDIRDLVRTIGNQLNSSNMENPFPVYPHNPFNRRPFTYEQLMKIKKRVHLLNIGINIAFKKFLLADDELIKTCYCEAIHSSNNYSFYLCEHIYDYCRWRTINEMDSQGCFIGRWIRDDYPLSEFEMLYDDWKDEPYHTLNAWNDIVDNPRKNYLFEMLRAMDDDYEEHMSTEKL
jgi:hypothetical protein